MTREKWCFHDCDLAFELRRQVLEFGAYDADAYDDWRPDRHAMEEVL